MNTNRIGILFILLFFLMIPGCKPERARLDGIVSFESYGFTKDGKFCNYSGKLIWVYHGSDRISANNKKRIGNIQKLHSQQVIREVLDTLTIHELEEALSVVGTNTIIEPVFFSSINSLLRDDKPDFSRSDEIDVVLVSFQVDELIDSKWINPKYQEILNQYQK